MRYLVDVMTRHDVVERAVEIIQQLDDLYRATFRRQLREPDNIGEVDRHATIQLWSHTSSNLELLGNRTVHSTSHDYIPIHIHSTLFMNTFVNRCVLSSTLINCTSSPL